MQPKYLNDLHLAIDSITGTPRITKVDPNHPYVSDTYKTVPRDEFEYTIMAYIDKYKQDEPLFLVKDGWSFVLGANASNKEQAIKILKNALKDLEQIKNE